MRIQIYTQHYAPEVTACRYRVEAFAERFLAHGHEVDVICPVPNHPEGVVSAEYRNRALVRRNLDGVRVAYVWTRPSPKRTGRARLLYYGSYASAAVAAGLALRRPDLILATSPPLSVPAAAAAVATLRRRPWVFDVRDLWPKAAELIGELTNPGAIRAAERLERALYERADLIVAVTRPFQDQIAAHLNVSPSKVELIANGTTREWLDAGREDVDRSGLGLPSGRFLWTYAGNLGPSRRLDVAIDAARILGPDFLLVIVGDGPTRTQLQRLAERTAPGMVSFEGLQPADRAARYLRASDALLVPQRRGLGDFVPSKLYDCAAIGRPLVVAADGETLRLATSAGICVGTAPDDPEAMARAVSDLRADPARAQRLGAQGRRFAAEYRRDRQGDRLVELSESLVAP